jgi:hypothetical protein
VLARSSEGDNQFAVEPDRLLYADEWDILDVSTQE